MQQNDGVSGENEEMDITEAELEPLLAQFDGEATKQEVQNWLAGLDEPCCQELSKDDILQQVNYIIEHAKCTHNTTRSNKMYFSTGYTMSDREF